MSNYIKKYNVSGVTARLFELIQNMTEEEQLELLSEFGEKRMYPRKAYIMPVKYEIKEGAHCDYITNISCGGVFITTAENLSVGQEMLLSFSLRGVKDTFKIDGRVVRKTDEGVGVQFIFINEKQQEMLKDFVESLK